MTIIMGQKQSSTTPSAATTTAAANYIPAGEGENRRAGLVRNTIVRHIKQRLPSKERDPQSQQQQQQQSPLGQRNKLSESSSSLLLAQEDSVSTLQSSLCAAEWTESNHSFSNSTLALPPEDDSTSSAYGSSSFSLIPSKKKNLAARENNKHFNSPAEKEGENDDAQSQKTTRTNNSSSSTTSSFRRRRTAIDSAVSATSADGSPLVQEFYLKKRRPVPHHHGMPWQEDPTGNTWLHSNVNWPRDFALVRGTVVEIPSKVDPVNKPPQRWLLATEVKQPSNDKWCKAPKGAALPFFHGNLYMLVPNKSYTPKNPYVLPPESPSRISICHNDDNPDESGNHPSSSGPRSRLMQFKQQPQQESMSSLVSNITTSTASQGSGGSFAGIIKNQTKDSTSATRTSTRAINAPPTRHIELQIPSLSHTKEEGPQPQPQQPMVRFDSEPEVIIFMNDHLHESSAEMTIKT